MNVNDVCDQNVYDVSFTANEDVDVCDCRFLIGENVE